MVLILAYALLFIVLRGKILFTPDFDRSDAFHFNVALKYYLWQSLHQNTLPFWTQQLQGGFPLLAEGQIGALFLPNLVLYRLFSFADAYMLSFVGSFFLFSLGFYLLLRQQGIRSILSLFLSLSAAFSGFITFRWVHFNIVQTVSLMPLLFLSAQYAYFRSGFKHKILHSFIIAELIFAGHIQISFIALFSLSLWYIALTWQGKKERWQAAWKGFATRVLPLLFLGFLFALPQILPTLLLMRYASRTNAAGYSFATDLSYPLNHLMSFITPYFYGNPQYHTYPLVLSKWGVFWENTPYIGELLSCLIFASIIVAAIKKGFSKNKGFIFLVLSAFLVLLAFGGNSPLYFIFDLPPFNLFRTPAKYLIPAAFFLLWGGAFYIDKTLSYINNRKVAVFIYGLILINTAILLKTAFSYHVFADAKMLLSKKAITFPLAKNDRYLTYGYSSAWSLYLGKHGWEKPQDVQQYLHLNSNLIPNTNFIYGGENFDINTGGLRFRRVDMINYLLANNFAEPSQAATASAMKLLSVIGVNTLIATDPLTGIDKEMQPVKDEYGYLHYHIVQPQPGYYLPSKTYQAMFAEDFDAFFASGKIATDTAMVEGMPSSVFTGHPSVKVMHDSEKVFKGELTSDKRTFFVIAKNWYPEWNVTLDGRKVDPVKVNFIHMGIIVPPGRHIIEAVYVPFTLYAGFGIAFMALTAALLIAKFRGWK